ncbi:hypothetical protein PR048_026154 [Dryococelus australis]|uniref:Uncharacterized protein n=1 Tax=Dryococelus australis TaxID=614101 RepID=A0ABQ9GKJ9_9NEOP|nr:hypothetical protein PR048_026154 [Dryococelus australis]
MLCPSSKIGIFGWANAEKATQAQNAEMPSMRPRRGMPLPASGNPLKTPCSSTPSNGTAGLSYEHAPSTLTTRTCFAHDKLMHSPRPCKTLPPYFEQLKLRTTSDHMPASRRRSVLWYYHIKGREVGCLLATPLQRNNTQVGKQDFFSLHQYRDCILEQLVFPRHGPLIPLTYAPTHSACSLSVASLYFANQICNSRTLLHVSKAHRLNYHRTGGGDGAVDTPLTGINLYDSPNTADISARPDCCPSQLGRDSLGQAHATSGFNSRLRHCTGSTLAHRSASSPHWLGARSLRHPSGWNKAAPECKCGETGDPRENPPTSGFVRHDSHLRTSGMTRPGIEPGSPWCVALDISSLDDQFYEGTLWRGRLRHPLGEDVLVWTVKQTRLLGELLRSLPGRIAKRRPRLGPDNDVGGVWPSRLGTPGEFSHGLEEDGGAPLVTPFAHPLRPPHRHGLAPENTNKAWGLLSTLHGGPGQFPRGRGVKVERLEDEWRGILNLQGWVFCSLCVNFDVISPTPGSSPTRRYTTLQERETFFSSIDVMEASPALGAEFDRGRTACVHEAGWTYRAVARHLEHSNDPTPQWPDVGNEWVCECVCTPASQRFGSAKKDRNTPRKDPWLDYEFAIVCYRYCQRTDGGVGRHGPMTSDVSSCTAMHLGNALSNMIVVRAPQKKSSGTHKTPYDRVKRCRERKIISKASERVNVDVFTQNKRPCPQHSHTPNSN